MDKLLQISHDDVDEINKWLVQDPTLKGMLDIVEEMGGVEELNRRAAKSQDLPDIMARLKKENSKYVPDLEWLMEQKEKKAFVPLEEYKKKVLGDKYGSIEFKREKAVTLEISALNNFQWLIHEAKKAIKNKELMPSRYILVRPMKEQEEMGELLPLVAGMKIIGASFVETLDTKGTLPTAADGGPANIHLGGPPTITGYFGGIGMPNEMALEWVKEFLHYYAEFGVKQVLNINPGTVLLGYMLHKIGIDLEFKISVFMGNDNPMSCLWTLMAAKMFSRPDGTTSLIGFNLSNSADVKTVEAAANIRHGLGFDDVVRLEHHITECSKSIVRQPYHRLPDLVELANAGVVNISAKHEGAIPETDATREHPSDILDYFLPAADREKMDDALLINYLDKHDAVNVSAVALIKAGRDVIAATELH